MSTMRLIDANALIEKAYWHGEHPDVGNPFAEGVDAVDVSDIDEAPVIEVEPVRHGQWIIEMDDLGWLKYTCPNCGYVKRTDIHVSLGWNYCPNCGTKMDLEG